MTIQRLQGMRLMLCAGLVLCLLAAGLLSPAWAQDPETIPDLTQILKNVVAPADESGAAPPATDIPLEAEPSADATANLPPQPEAADAAVGPDTAPLADPLSPGMILPVGEKEVADLLANPDEANNATNEAMRKEAFDTSLQNLFPMRPSEIRKVLQTFDETREAVETPINPLPDAVVEFTSVPLDPGSTPLTFKLATGHVTTVTFLDMTGEPWPIQDVSWAGNFEILQPEAGGNILRITPLGEHVVGNLSLRLVNLTTPVTFSLRTGRDVVQYRLDLQIPETGPNARAPLIAGSNAPTLSAGEDRTLTDLLEGIVPSDVVTLNVAGTDNRTRAYRKNSVTYVRTPLTLLSPSWNASVRSADGMNVYALAQAPILLLSDQGVMVRTTLSEPVATGDAF